MIISITPASVRCPECGAEVDDPQCYTRDDEPTGYHASRRRAAEELQAMTREEKRRARAARAAQRTTEQALRGRLQVLERENRILREALAAVADVVTAATRPRGRGEEDR